MGIHLDLNAFDSALAGNQAGPSFFHAGDHSHVEPDQT